jgi:hypothetical protein
MSITDQLPSPDSWLEVKEGAYQFCRGIRPPANALSSELPRGNDEALRIERVLLREQPYDDGSIAANLHAEILFDEFTGHVQRRWIDGLDA